MSLADIQAMTPQQAQTAFTKTQLLAAIFEGIAYTVDDGLQKDQYGNSVLHAWKVRDRFTDALISKHRVEWDYWDVPTGNVRDIKTYEIRREEGVVIKRLTVIRHTAHGTVETFTKEKVVPTPEEAVGFGE